MSVTTMTIPGHNNEFAVVPLTDRIIREIGGWEPITLTRGFTRHISGGGFTRSDHPVQICNPYRGGWAHPGTYDEIVRRLGGEGRNLSVLRSQDKGAIASLCAKLEMPFVPVRPVGDGSSFEATLRLG